MSITKSKSFTTTDGNTYPTLELAQQAEIQTLFLSIDTVKDPAGVFTPGNISVMSEFIVGLRTEFIAILCASGRKPRTVKAKGNGVKKRRAKPLDKIDAALAGKSGVVE